jgi:hypothetical protein
VDWVLAPKDPIPENLASRSDEAQSPNIGMADTALVEFGALLERWLTRDDLPPLARLAFGAVLTHPVSGFEEGNQRMQEYVPIPLGPDWTDFVFQVNAPAASELGIQGLRINRLAGGRL